MPIVHAHFRCDQVQLAALEVSGSPNSRNWCASVRVGASRQSISIPPHSTALPPLRANEYGLLVIMPGYAKSIVMPTVPEWSRVGGDARIFVDRRGFGDHYSSDTSPVYPIGGTLAKCDPFGTPSTSHWTGAAIIVESPRTKTCIVTRSRISTRPMPFSLAG